MGQNDPIVDREWQEYRNVLNTAQTVEDAMDRASKLSDDFNAERPGAGLQLRLLFACLRDREMKPGMSDVERDRVRSFLNVLLNARLIDRDDWKGVLET